MTHVLAVGNATVDIVNVVEEYPEEDAEVRALCQRVSRGGNATNTLVALSQLGHRCTWAGTLAEEPDTRLILADLERHRIDTGPVRTSSHGKVPTSYITLSRRTGTRTIVHHRDLPEYGHGDFARIPLDRFQWVHFEGRNIAETRLMMDEAARRRPAPPCSLEVEKPRDGIERLFPGARLLLFSRVYARHRGFDAAPPFLREMHRRFPSADLVCAWGHEGAWALGRDGRESSCPAVPLAEVVDTVGAGDVFNAGIIDGLLSGLALDKALKKATDLAGKKCGQYGLANLAG